MDALTLSTTPNRTAVIIHQLTLGLDIILTYETADELARMMRMKVNGQRTVDRESVDGNLTVLFDGRLLIVEWQGKLFFNVIPQGAQVIANAITVKAREVEEQFKANEIIADAALLLRAGVPLGLTDRPDITAEALREAQSNPELRKYLPLGIKSVAIFGVPKVIQSPPPEDSSGN